MTPPTPTESEPAIVRFFRATAERYASVPLPEKLTLVLNAAMSEVCWADVERLISLSAPPAGSEPREPSARERELEAAIEPLRESLEMAVEAHRITSKYGAAWRDRAESAEQKLADIHRQYREQVQPIYNALRPIERELGLPIGVNAVETIAEMCATNLDLKGSLTERTAEVERLRSAAEKLTKALGELTVVPTWIMNASIELERALRTEKR